MFKYINMPKLVAWYLREFSVNSSGTPSKLYEFVLCLCLPFVSPTFRRARLIALAIAECTQSADQIKRLLHKITGCEVSIVSNSGAMMPYKEIGEPLFMSLVSGGEMMTFSTEENIVTINVTSDTSFSQTEFESYLNLLMPFYVEYRIEYGAGQPVNSNVLFNTGFLRPDDILTPDSYLKTYI